MQLINSREAKVSETAVLAHAKRLEYAFLTYQQNYHMQEKGIPSDVIAEELGISLKEAKKKKNETGLMRARERMSVARSLLESF